MRQTWEIFLALLLVASTVTQASESESPLKVAVVPDHSPSDGVQFLDHSTTSDNKMQFDAVLSNVSAQPVVVWEQNCLWGWDCLSFDVTRDGRHQRIEHKPFPGGSTIPRPFHIPPGGCFVFKVYMNRRYYPIDWVPDWDGQNHEVTLQAIYTIKPVDPDDDFVQRYARELWTGSVSSTPATFTLR